MATNINWSTLGVGIPTQYSKDYEAVKLNPEAFGKGMDELGSVFDRWNREKALGQVGNQKVEALKSKVSGLETKLASLSDELSAAMSSDMSGYVPANAEGAKYDNYVPEESAENSAYSRAYAMMGAGHPSVRF